MSVGTSRIADIRSVNEEVRNSGQGHFASIALGESCSEAGSAPVSTGGALEVAGVSELISGTLHSAFVHVEEVAESIDALAGLTDSGRSAEGAGGTALRADIADCVWVLSGVACRSAGRESDLKIG